MGLALGAFAGIGTLAPSVHAVDTETSAEEDAGKVGKKGSAPPEFKTREEYDAEAKLRIENFTLPDDIGATLFADPSQTQNPSAICFDRQGRLYIAEIHRWRAGVMDIRNEQQVLLDDLAVVTNEDRLAMYEKDQVTRPLSYYSEYEDRIVRVEDRDGDGRADHSAVWADGFNDPLDGPGIGLLALEDGSLFYTNIPHLWKLEDSDGDGTADEKESVQDGFGVRMSLSGHDMHGLVRGPDGKIYWSIGDRGYTITTDEGRHYSRPYEGAVFRCDPDGSNVEEVYRGLRNPQELAFDQHGNLFTCDNDADAWDTGRLVYILEGGDSGWNHGHQVLLNFRNQLGLRTPDYEHPGKEKTVPLNPWTTEGLWEPREGSGPDPGRPDFALPPVDSVSWGPSGLVYNYGATAMPERYDGHFWVCNFGGAKGDLETFSVKSDGAGFALDQHEIFMVGLGNTDVEFGPDGRMYLSCFNNNGWVKQDIGNIYALAGDSLSSGRADLIGETEEWLTTPIGDFDAAQLAALLRHTDMRVRLRAQWALADRGETEKLLAAARGGESLLERLHGIWGIGQLARQDESLLDSLIELLDDDEVEVRAQAAKTLADTRSAKAGEALASALADDSPRVRSFAAIGVGKCRNAAALPQLVELLAENDNRDPWLRHAAVQGLWYLHDSERTLKAGNHESAAVRLGIVLALRKWEDPRVKYFLHDEDKRVRDAAIRAINDLDLVTALPDLAEMLGKAPVGTATVPSDSGKKDKDAGKKDKDAGRKDVEENVPAGESAPHREWLMQSRLINANFRLGKAENAERLLAYAADSAQPGLLRNLSLEALAEWPEPTPVDATVGHYRPLDPADRDDIAGTVQEHIGSVFENATGPLLGTAVRVALQYDAKAPEDLLEKQIRDEKADTRSRVDSLEGLARQAPAALAPLWDELLASGDPGMRAAAVKTLLELEPERGLDEALALVASENLPDQQNGYALLAGVEDERAAAVFAEGLARPDRVVPGALLDLLEGAARRSEKGIAEALAKYRASLDASDPLAAYRACLEGGDIAKGREIFTTHAAAQCAKCHKVGGGSEGEAGPDLAGVGSRGDRHYLLESLVNPSAEVVPGYGLTLITLEDGESVGGPLLREDDEKLVLRVPDSENPSEQVEREIPLDQIASRQPPVSAMPPVAALLSKREVRDLVAFLASLKEGE